MAEGIARHFVVQSGLNEWKIHSAGVFAVDGAPTSLEAVCALKKQGIKFNGLSTALKPSMLQQATHIFCMTKSHKQSVLHLVPDATGVSLLDSEGSIADPIGQSQDVYDAVAQHMYKLIKHRISEINEETNKEEK